MKTPQTTIDWLMAGDPGNGGRFNTLRAYRILNHVHFH